MGNLGQIRKHKCTSRRRYRGSEAASVSMWAQRPSKRLPTFGIRLYADDLDDLINQIKDMFRIEITQLEVPGIASNFLKLTFTTCTSTNSKKLIFQKFSQWLRNRPPKFLRRFLSGFGKLRHPLVTSGDVGGMSSTLSADLPGMVSTPLG